MGFTESTHDKYGDARGESIERVIELFYAAIRLIFLVIDAPSRAGGRCLGRENYSRSAEKLAWPPINHTLPTSRLSSVRKPKRIVFFRWERGGMMMKHGHAKRVINSCPSCVSPFYSLSARSTEREREKIIWDETRQGLIHAMQQESLINACFFQRSRFHLFGTFKRERVESV